jgi:cobalt-zinc-cadmium efflux system outer membrane protein
MKRGWLKISLAWTLGCSLVYAEESNECLLDYSSAVQRIVQGSPKIQIAQLEVEVKQAEEKQVALLPNPLLSLEVDELRDCKSTEISLGVTQPILTGGKRAALRKIAATATDKALWEKEIVKLDVLASMSHAFIDAVCLQEKICLLIEQYQVSQNNLECVKAQVHNQQVPPILEKKAYLALVAIQISLEKTQRLLDAAYKKLASFWGQSCPDFSTLVYPLWELETPPVLEVFQCVLDSTPEMELARWEVCFQAASVKLHKARRVPDLTITAGISLEDRFRKPAAFLELDIPIPIFDRNQGNLERARLQECQAITLLEDIEYELNAKLETAWAEWGAAYQSALLLQGLSSATALEALQAKEEGYGLGKWGHQEVLEAQKIYFDVKEQYLEAAAEYQHKKIDILRLTAQIGLSNCTT